MAGLLMNPDDIASLIQPRLLFKVHYYTSFCHHIHLFATGYSCPKKACLYNIVS
jgi:hypothetical protein